MGIQLRVNLNVQVLLECLLYSYRCVLCTFFVHICGTSCAFHIKDNGESYFPLLFSRLLSCFGFCCVPVVRPPCFVLIVKEKALFQITDTSSEVISVVNF